MRTLGHDRRVADARRSVVRILNGEQYSIWCTDLSTAYGMIKRPGTLELIGPKEYQAERVEDLEC